MEITCTQMDVLISFYIEGDLSKPLKKNVEEHLNKCETCRAKYEILKSMLTDLRNAVELPDNYDKKFEVLTKWDPKLNESKAGTYKISYWVVDSSGNVSEIITRTVIVEKENNALVYLIIAGIVAFVALVGIVGYFKEFKRKKNG